MIYLGAGKLDGPLGESKPNHPKLVASTGYSPTIPSRDRGVSRHGGACLSKGFICWNNVDLNVLRLEGAKAAMFPRESKQNHRRRPPPSSGDFAQASSADGDLVQTQV